MTFFCTSKAGIGPGAERLSEWMKNEPFTQTKAVFDVPDEEMDQLFNS
jgi:hypothetical protein